MDTKVTQQRLVGQCPVAPQPVIRQLQHPSRDRLCACARRFCLFGLHPNGINGQFVDAIGWLPVNVCTTVPSGIDTKSALNSESLFDSFGGIATGATSEVEYAGVHAETRCNREPANMQHARYRPRSAADAQVLSGSFLAASGSGLR